MVVCWFFVVSCVFGWCLLFVCWAVVPRLMCVALPCWITLCCCCVACGGGVPLFCVVACGVCYCSFPCCVVLL